MKVSTNTRLVIMYLVIGCIFIINVKMFLNFNNTTSTVNSNTIQIKLVNQQIKLLAKNDSIFLSITNDFRNSDSIRLSWVKKNNKILKENNIMLKEILTKIK